MKDSENLEEHGKNCAVDSAKVEARLRNEEDARQQIQNDKAGRNQKCHNAEAALFAAKPGLGGTRIGTFLTPGHENTRFGRVRLRPMASFGQFLVQQCWPNWANLGVHGVLCLCVCGCWFHGVVVGGGFTVCGVLVWRCGCCRPRDRPALPGTAALLSTGPSLLRWTAPLFFLPPGLCRELVAAVQGCGCPMGVWASLWSFCAKNVICGGRGNNVRNSGPPLLD